MTHFGDALAARVARTSPVCVGLDVPVDRLPEGLPRTAEGVEAFARGIASGVNAQPDLSWAGKA